MIAPWWLLAGMSVLGAIPTIFQVEGKGFVRAEEIDEASEHDQAREVDEEEVLRAEGFVGGAEAAGDMPSPILSPALRHHETAGDGAGPPRDLSKLPRQE